MNNLILPDFVEEMWDWLTAVVRTDLRVERIFEELCTRLNSGGVRVARSALYFYARNPEWLGGRIVWQPGLTCKLETFDYAIWSSPQYLLSPARELNDGADEVRVSLKSQADGDLKYPIYSELRDEGLTEYVGLPIKHTLGGRHVISFATDAVSGFEDLDMAILRKVTAMFALVSEVRLKNVITTTLLDTYVGAQASKEILAGATRRGTGATIEAFIMICDMRGFSSRTNGLTRDQVIELLNDFFDATAEPVEMRGGEILKFMGDGFLAVFPASNPRAVENLLSAIDDIEKALHFLSLRRQSSPKIECGIGVHFGEVVYGNVGSRARLDFTVVGRAVNVAARLEELTKSLGTPVLFSEAFVQRADHADTFQPVGTHSLRGISNPLKLYKRVSSGLGA